MSGSIPIISVSNQADASLLLCDPAVAWQRLLLPGQHVSVRSTGLRLWVRTAAGEWGLAQCLRGVGAVAIGTHHLQWLRQKATRCLRRMTTPS